MSAAPAVAVAVTFCWLGMVLAISFLEAPLKFRAPGVTLQIGLGIGRLVFRALNATEIAFAAVIVIALTLAGPSAGVMVAFAVAIVALVVQLVAVRPKLTQRSDAVLSGIPGEGTATRSRVHYVYIALEAAKIIALLVGGILLFAG